MQQECRRLNPGLRAQGSASFHRLKTQGPTVVRSHTYRPLTVISGMGQMSTTVAKVMGLAQFW